MQVKYKEGICSCCGKPKLIYQKSKKLCFYCYQKFSFAKQQAKRKEKIKSGALDYNKLNNFYKEVWKSHNEHVCFETGAPLYAYKKWFVHHLLPKSKYPQYAFNIDICILLTLEMHSLFHSLGREQIAIKMPKTYKKLLEIENKYDV